MRILITIFNGLLDSCFSLLLPKWRRQGQEALTALTSYINYHRTELAPERLTHLMGEQADLKEALHCWNGEKVKTLTESIKAESEQLRGFNRNGMVEIAESFFVIMVIFLGIRTYYAQPFRIPTGSMQPTLNGIIIHPIEDEADIPGTAEKIWNAIKLGSSYVNEVSDSHKKLIGTQQQSKHLIFTETLLKFDDGSQISVPTAEAEVIRYLRDHGKDITEYLRTGDISKAPEYKPGEVIIRARMDAGDMVVVNRMAYHFRKPKRGETFVFDTRAIRTDLSSSLSEQQGGTHYIKRLCGLPGDTISISDSQVYVNGEPAKEATIARVAAGEAPYNEGGYKALLHSGFCLTEGAQVQLSESLRKPTLREYIALGDNTDSSLDSRYWGPVHQFNILGPAALTLWPFTSHWGAIE